MLLQTQLLALPKLYVLLGAIVFISLYAFLFLVIASITTILFLNLDYCHRQVNSREMDMSLTGAALPIDLAADVQVKQASVQAHADDAMAHHLDQVYRAQDYLANAIQQEEDRMPTLLFDEEMAKQLADHEAKLKQEKESSKNTDEEPPSIKISK